jgi:hypothetical protein
MALAIVGSAGTREIVIDLSGASTLAIRPVNNWIKVDSFWLSGETTITNCTVSVTDAASVVVWHVEANTTVATKFNIDKTFSPPGRLCNGLSVTTSGAWSANSRLIVYTA